MRIDNCVRIHGGIEIHVTEFEKLWASLLRRYCPEFEWDNASLMGAWVTKFKQLGYPPPFTSDSAEELLRQIQWIDEILCVMDDLPGNLTALIADMKIGRVGPYPLDLFNFDPLRWQVFTRWLKEKSLDVPELSLPRLRNVGSSPTDPLRKWLDDQPGLELI